MNDRLRGAGLVALIAALAGCGSPPPTGSAEVDPSRTPSATPLVQGLGIWCGDGAVFPAIHLEQTGRADRTGDAAADALRAYLSSREGGPWGASSWVRVAQSPEQVQFLGRRADGTRVYVLFTRRLGAWEPDLAGNCSVSIPFESGTSPVDWWLDPVLGSRPGSLELGLLLGRVPCDPGDPLLEYVLPPVVVEGESEVSVAILSQDRGVEYCVGRIPMVVELSAPIGGRDVFDGGVYPARRVTFEPP